MRLKFHHMVQNKVENTLNLTKYKKDLPIIKKRLVIFEKIYYNIMVI